MPEEHIQTEGIAVDGISREGVLICEGHNMHFEPDLVGFAATAVPECLH